MEIKKQPIVLIILLMIAMLIIGILGGYTISLINDKSQNDSEVKNNEKIEENDSISDDSEVKNNEKIEENDSTSDEESIPYYEDLLSITYYHTSPDIEYKFKINNRSTMKKILSIFKDKTVVVTEPDGLGGAGSIYLILEYESSEIKIHMVGPDLIRIGDQYYNVNYDGDYYTILEDIF